MSRFTDLHTTCIKKMFFSECILMSSNKVALYYCKQGPISRWFRRGVRPACGRPRRRPVTVCLQGGTPRAAHLQRIDPSFRYSLIPSHEWSVWGNTGRNRSEKLSQNTQNYILLCITGCIRVHWGCVILFRSFYLYY